MGNADGHFPIVVTGAEDAGRLTVRAPYDESVIGTVGVADAPVVEKALTQAYALFRQRDGWLPAWRRIGILSKAADIMEREKEELIRGAAREGGKPYVDTRVEVERAIFRVDWMPFAGLRQSGLGIGGIPHTMRDMRINKMLVFHSSSLV